MLKYLFCCSFVVMLLGTFSATFAQTGAGEEGQQQPQQNQQQSTGGTLELGGFNLERSQELPQVQILDRRKAVKFDEVRVAKDFQSELSGKSEELQLASRAQQTVKPIKNIKTLLNKSRF
ncbi:MAG: hypothetical protein R3C41_01205 [Calditrichia bacterium]|nr:hypothetical protein [Calditrichota bacterium]MCB0267128.1 hypothetical protein [Calditrichota bacterium]MCB0285209.1 hypothetical protein [Calditrichota bacterium]MCB9066399.1 hypothetical protein [Calditrichia bacterium]